MNHNIYKKPKTLKKKFRSLTTPREKQHFYRLLKHRDLYRILHFYHFHLAIKKWKREKIRDRAWYYQNLFYGKYTFAASCEVSIDRTTGIILCKVIVKNHLEREIELNEVSLNSIQVFFLSIIRDQYHVHFHHNAIADSCLPPVPIPLGLTDMKKIYKIIVSNVEHGYRRKFFSFVRNVSHLEQRKMIGKILDAVRYVLLYRTEAISRIQDYRGELLFAHSFIKKNFAHSPNPGDFQEFLNHASESFLIKFQTFSDLRNFYLTRIAIIVAVIAAIASIAALYK